MFVFVGVKDILILAAGGEPTVRQDVTFHDSDDGRHCFISVPVRDWLGFSSRYFLMDWWAGGIKAIRTRNGQDAWLALISWEALAGVLGRRAAAARHDKRLVRRHDTTAF
ncbi:hypothetical protein JDV02_007405 [Purpureocillium takamizusanense]|uniref:Uncharacterized protein n=1 Tax=Purpureocillium takamizusanense TaxID=2060973 RepID=A0A9Q8VDP4_9HYPO|nr:uncharacterized protein JDV02_007405 [Purpureocillium takamizusanense]UNI21411.1 hypothetical protein JDV02_007405 [Purpureocillium takamizusanense]